MNPQSVTSFAPVDGIKAKAHRKEKNFKEEFTIIYHNPSGSGVAEGYNYHRPSAATAEAIETAGFTLAEPMEGRGQEAMEEALKAIALHLGMKPESFYLHHSNA